MAKGLHGELREYWQIFRDTRFTRSELWRWFRGAYYHAGGKDSWPREDFIRWLSLDGKPWIDSAPGPRGGQGWQIATDAVDLCLAEEAFIQRTHLDASHLISSVRVRLGALELKQELSVPRVWGIVWRFQPPFPVAGPGVDGAARVLATDSFWFQAPYDCSVSDLQASVEDAESHVCLLLERTAEYHQQCLDDINRLIRDARR